MTILNKKEPSLLLFGDLLVFSISLWLALFLRNFNIPSVELFVSFLIPFSILFVVWILVFFISGLYEKHTSFLRSRLPGIILNSHIANIIIAFLFFYLVPIFGIAPKTTLIIYLVISFALIFAWRLYLVDLILPKKRSNAVLIGTGEEMQELYDEVNKNTNYGLHFTHCIDLQKDINFNFLNKSNVSVVVVDLEHDKVSYLLPKLYSLIFSNKRFVSMHKLYEDIFKRVPFFILKHDWFLENISTSPKFFYDFIKRITDIVLSFVLGLISLPIYPFVYLAIKMDDRGPIFIKQERIGLGGEKITIPKFRSMKTDDRGVWVKEKDNRITRVGKILRKSRIDELPQLWSVLKGDISLIGPRPDIYDLGINLSSVIPYYTLRNTVKPGLSGWAQVSQELPPQSQEETEVRLAYDLYYVKNRSILLDLNIILKTIKTLLSRSGK